MYRIFVINPGSTSTKITLFEDDRYLFDVVHPESIDHPSNPGVQLAKEFQKICGGGLLRFDDICQGIREK